MRPKVFVVIILIGVTCVLALFKLKQADAGSRSGSDVSRSHVVAVDRTNQIIEGTQKPSSGQAANNGAMALTKGETEGSNNPTISQAKVNATKETPLSHEEFVEKRTAELMDLGMNDDAGSLSIIVSELENADPEIQKAAVEATKQFGSTDAISSLTAAADRARSPQEKAMFQEAIEFLKLPSLTARQ